MFVGEDFLVPCAKIAHDFLMHALDMSMEVWPAQAGNVAAWIRTVVSQEEDLKVGRYGLAREQTSRKMKGGSKRLKAYILLPKRLLIPS